jgi:putative ABC transport system permease protein
MMTLARLFCWFILRALWREKVRTAITVLGIALGLAVMLAVRLANRSATDSFRAAMESVRGRTDLCLRGVAGRFPETLLTDLGWLAQYATVSPVIESYVLAEDRAAENRPGHMVSTAGQGDVLHLLGVDILVDQPIRQYHLLRTSGENREPTTQELLRLLADPHAIVLTQRYAHRHGKQLGDRISLVFGSQRQEVVIRGLLLDEGPARALDGNFALMDLAAAQWACKRLGYLDRVDLALHAGLDRDQAAAEIARRLPAGLIVEPPQADADRAETMIAAFHFNLLALSGVALLVGLFLIYNTVAISVAARREEIGILQAVGTGRRSVLALFLAEALALAALGIAIGLPLGQFLARGTVLVTAQTVETFYIAQVAGDSARHLSLTATEVSTAITLTLLLVLAAAAVPALRAAGVQPVEVLRSGQQMSRNFRPPRRYLLISAALAAAGGGACLLPPIQGLPVMGFLAGLAFMLAGAWLVPGLLWLGCWLVRGPLARIRRTWQSALLLAGANLLGAISRVSISVAALGVSLALMVAIAVMVGSFRETVVYWLHSTLQADLMVRPAMLTSSMSEAEIDPATLERLRADPDVVSLGWVRVRQIPYGTRSIRLAAAPLAMALEHKTLLFKEGFPTLPSLQSQGVLISESFSLRFHKHPGDMVELPTPAGLRPLGVVAVYYDYASNQGTVTLDIATYDRLFGEPAQEPAASSVAIYLRRGADPEVVRARLARSVGTQRGLYFATQDNVRREALRIFDSTFTVTYALQLIAIVIAGLGVVATLMTLLYERQREIALVALLGAGPRELRRMVVVEAVLIGLVSQIAGLLIGMALAAVLIYVINVQSFGWTIQLHVPWWFLLESGLLILAATLVCGYYPAVRAAQANAIRAAREE